MNETVKQLLIVLGIFIAGVCGLLSFSGEKAEPPSAPVASPKANLAETDVVETVPSKEVEQVVFTNPVQAEGQSGQTNGDIEAEGESGSVQPSDPYKALREGKGLGGLSGVKEDAEILAEQRKKKSEEYLKTVSQLENKKSAE